MKYLNRHIDQVLEKWKDAASHKPLLIRGARQVGKSSAVRHLGERFENFVEVNLELNKRLHTIFDFDLDPARICTELAAVLQTQIVPGKTLLFLDEIQSCENAIRSLWFFKEQYPELHVIAAGSLLEFALTDLPSFGVGRVRSIYLYPFSFDEFLLAQGMEGLYRAKKLASPTQPLSEILHEQLAQQLRYYYLVGGMPEVVQTWIETKDYPECREMHADIMDTYLDDFNKYNAKVSPDLLRKTVRAIVRQIGSKFKYASVEGGTNNYQIKKALETLIKAGLIIPVTHTAANGQPLGGEANEKFQKFIFVDIALMLHMQAISADDILLCQADEFVNKGGIAEMFAGLELMKYAKPNMRAELFYWQGEGEPSPVDGKKSQAEVDYIIANADGVIPMEIKAGKRGSMQSLYTLLQKKSNIPFGIRCALENFSTYERVRVYPLYAISNFASS